MLSGTPAVLRAIFRDKVSIGVLLDGLFFHHLPAMFIPRNGESITGSFIFSGVSLLKNDGTSLMELTEASGEVLTSPFCWFALTLSLILYHLLVDVPHRATAALQLARLFAAALARSESPLPYGAASHPVTHSHPSKRDQASWRTGLSPSRNVDLLLQFDVGPPQDAETRRSTPTSPA